MRRYLDNMTIFSPKNNWRIFTFLYKTIWMTWKFINNRKKKSLVCFTAQAKKYKKSIKDHRRNR